MDALPQSRVRGAAVLVIGDEILSGRTKDKNIGYIADHLTAIGIQLKEVRVVPDEASGTGYAVRVGPFPGWRTLPSW